MADIRHLRPSTVVLPRLVSLDEYIVRPTISWLYRDLIPAESIIVVFGAPKSGKTHVVSDICMHGAHGMHWHGHTLSRPLRVAYLIGEGRNGHRVRLHAWRKYHATEMRGDIRLVPEALPLAERISDVIEILRDYAPDLVVIDTLNAYFGGADENSTQDMTAFVAALRRLRDELHTSVLTIHHTGLADATRERGSGVLRAAADVIGQVGRDASGSGLIGFQLLDGRDMEGWAEPLSLRLTSAQSDWLDDDGQPITTCLLESADQPVTLPGRGGRPLGEAQAIVLEIARELARSQVPDSSGHVSLARHDIAAAARTRGVSRQSVSSAWRPLHERGVLQLVEPGSVRVRVSR